MRVLDYDDMLQCFTKEEERIVEGEHSSIEDEIEERENTEAITRQEIKDIERDIKVKKSTKTGGLDNRELKISMKINPGLFQRLYQRCLSEGVFPKEWKRAAMVWLPKQGTGLRPISLLPAVGKAYDKLINRRIIFFLEGREGLSTVWFPQG